jgi:hypothetical protein
MGIEKNFDKKGKGRSSDRQTDLRILVTDHQICASRADPDPAGIAFPIAAKIPVLPVQLT